MRFPRRTTMAKLRCSRKDLFVIEFSSPWDSLKLPSTSDNYRQRFKDFVWFIGTWNLHVVNAQPSGRKPPNVVTKSSKEICRMRADLIRKHPKAFYGCLRRTFLSLVNFLLFFPWFIEPIINNCFSLRR